MADKNTDPSAFGVTTELYDAWRVPRFGDRNPTQMSNSVWDWLIRTKQSAYAASEMFNRSSVVSDGPSWCFDRYGQSCTELPDGRKIYIAGEHEDHYDPDFHIYNDVVVEGKDGSITIYGYPKNIFPPTDFHSATLVRSEIILIGNLGYPDARDSSSTQVLSLDTTSFVVRQLSTSGEVPGWIHEHQAALSDDQESILVTGGKADRGPDRSLMENINDWRLNISTGVWKCEARRYWPRWEIFRPDKSGNYIWHIRQALWSLGVGWEADYAKDMEALEKALGEIPDVRLVEELYRPDVQHLALPEREEEYGVYRIRVDGTTVRYVEEHHCIQITIEGELPEVTVRGLVEDVRKKISALENRKYDVAKIA